jgi:hypothetical protein
MAWYKSRFEGIILVCTFNFFSWTLLMLPLPFFSCCRNEYSSSRLVVLFILCAMTCHLLLSGNALSRTGPGERPLHLRILRMPTRQ